MPIISNFPGGTGSGGGLTLGAVSDINVLVASGKTYVKWTDPSDIVVSGAALAACSHFFCACCHEYYILLGTDFAKKKRAGMGF